MEELKSDSDIKVRSTILLEAVEKKEVEDSAISLEELVEDKLVQERNVFRKALKSIAFQALIYVLVSVSILRCWYNLRRTNGDIVLLIKTMYLYHSNVCASDETWMSSEIKDSTMLLDVSMDGFAMDECHRIPMQPSHLFPMSKVASKTRGYCHTTVILHIVWTISTIVLNIADSYPKIMLTRFITMAWITVTVLIIVFDITAAYHYTIDVQRCVTKVSMLQYSGFGGYRIFDSPDDFVGWIPLAAGMFWLRCFFGFGWNIWLLVKVFNILKDRKKRFFQGAFDEFDNTLLYKNIGEVDKSLKRELPEKSVLLLTDDNPNYTSKNRSKHIQFIK